MQEIEVPPRDVFQHLVLVDQPDKTLVWSFSTRRKNISFGLFKLKIDAPSLRSNTIAPSITSVSTSAKPESIRRPSHHQGSGSGQFAKDGILSTSPTKSSHYASSRASVSSTSDDEDLGGDGDDSKRSPSHSSQSTSSRPSPRKKKTVAKIKDLIEVLPIQHYESSSGTIRGEYTVKEQGTYVLVFDNSFSINTSKRLTFFVAIEERSSKSTVQPAASDMAGWLLKKKRKRMQGWAKRWFQVSNGVLTYYKAPDTPCRGKVHLVLSTITVSQNSRMIHIDSGTMLYHLKAFSTEEYNKWIGAMKKAKHSDKAAQDTVHRVKRESSVRRSRALRDSWIGGTNELDQLKEIMHSMDAGFQDIKNQLEAIRVQAEAPPSSGSSQKSSRKIIASLQRTTSDASIGTSYSSALESVQQKLQSSFAKLESDKDKAFDIMRLEIEKWEKNGSVAQGTALSRQPLEESQETSDRTRSFASSITGSDVFYDADDADEPEVLDLTSADLTDFDGDAHIDEDDNSSDDESAEEPVIEELQVAPVAAETAAPAAAGKAAPEAIPAAEEPIVRRTQLPAPVSGEDISLLSILRKNVGKDLSTVAMPVSLNEPINVLQRLCEELEYSELLDKAAGMSDSLDRLVYVTAFAVSGYSTTQWRAARKPFNPLHGETFEFVSPEKGFKFISEKVSHYPPIMACHAESVNHWSLAMDSRAKTKFWGKSMELIPNATIHIHFHKTGDHFTIQKPSTWMRNLMAGTKYLEHTGELKVTNHTTKESCVLTFKESSFFSGTKNEVAGHVMDANGNKKRTLQGRWSESLMEEVGPNKLERLWKISNPPANHEKYYGFSEFTIQLNELTKGLDKKLPKTDSRFRPDQSLFEHGNVEEADKEKLRVEQRQRDTRKAMEAKGEAWEVRWFERKADSHSEDPEGHTWFYKGGYWETRETGEWNEKVTLW